MAAPTPVSDVYVDGQEYYLTWYATWTTTDNFTDEVLVDRSEIAGSPKEIEIQRLVVQCTAGIDALIEFEYSTADALIAHTEVGNVSPTVIEPPVGRQGIRLKHNTAVPDANVTDGDIMLTTTSAASADGVAIQLWARLHF